MDRIRRDLRRRRGDPSSGNRPARELKLNFALIALLLTCVTPGGAFAGEKDLPETNGVISVGQKAPPIESAALDGRAFSLESFKGRPLFIDFGSVLCDACARMVEEMKRLQKKYGDTDLEFVMIADGAVPVETTEAFFSRLQVSFTVIRDEDWRFFDAYGVTVVPFKVVVDREGKIRNMHLGFEENLEKTLDFKGLLK